MAIETFEEYLQSLDDESLLIEKASADRVLEISQKHQGRIDQELCRRLEERGATVIASEAYEFEVPRRYDYPAGCFRPLLEVLSEADLVAAKAYTPAETVWVPTQTIPGHTEHREEAWDTRKVLSLAEKRGKEALAIIERGRVPKRVTPQFRKRES